MFHYRKGVHRGTHSAEAEALILQRTYLDPTGHTFQKNLPLRIRTGIVQDGEDIPFSRVSPNLFAAAEEWAESALISGLIPRFKLSLSFLFDTQTHFPAMIPLPIKSPAPQIACILSLFKYIIHAISITLKMSNEEARSCDEH